MLLLTLVTHMFSHGGWGHLLGNMTVGIPAMACVEHKLGSLRMVRLYLVSGAVGALMHSLIVPVGLIGASGAIFGCVAASCLLLGKGRASTALGMALLALILIPQIAQMSSIDGIAHAAHIGGALAGILCVAIGFKHRLSSNL